MWECKQDKQNPYPRSVLPSALLFFRISKLPCHHQTLTQRQGIETWLYQTSCVYKLNVYKIYSFTYQLGLKTHKWMPEWIMEVIPSNSTKEINRYCFSHELFDFQCTFLSVKDDWCNQSTFSPHLESGDFRAGALCGRDPGAKARCELSRGWYHFDSAWPLGFEQTIMILLSLWYHFLPGELALSYSGVNSSLQSTH